MKIPPIIAVMAMAFTVLTQVIAVEPVKNPVAIPTELAPVAIDTRDTLSADAGLRLVVPRDGYASALSVVRGPKIADLTVTPPRLTGPGGAVLPPEAVQVRWLSGDQFTPTPVTKEYREGRAVLGQQLHIMLTVHAPKAAAAGVYTGRLGVACEGFTGDLPVTVEVMPWVVPAPKDRYMLTGLIHSPDTIALQYKVEPWSDAHLKLMEPSLRLLNDLGSESCQVYLIAEAIINERYSMVRRRADGSPDFTWMDRYLDLWQKVCGQPKKLTLYLWDQSEGAPPWSATNSVKVTQIKADGTLENIRAPYYGTPGSKAFWQPVFDGIRDRLAKRGWKDTEVLLGTPGDQGAPAHADRAPTNKQPEKEVVLFFQEVAPGWRWRVFAYGIYLPSPDTSGKLVLTNGLEVGWLEGVAPLSVYPTKRDQGASPADIVRGVGMKRSYPLTVASGNIGGWSGIHSWLDVYPLTMRGAVQGLSQVGLDFWAMPVEKGRGTFDLTRKSKSPNPWQKNLHESLPMSLTTPSPTGAEPNLSYELLREGMQVAEAFLQVRNHDARLPEEVRYQATETYELFDALVHCRLKVPSGRRSGTWNSAVRELYRMAELLKMTPIPPTTAPEPAKPITFSADEIGGLRLVVPRDGYALSTRASLAGPQLTGISATPTPLTGPDGAVVPAEAVQVRWFKDDQTFILKPADGKRQYLVLLVHAPKDAKPGVYTGSLKVTCQGFEGSLPIRLEIMAYVISAPKDWPMLTAFIHSPDAITRQYKVEPWSDEHLKYMEPSLRLLRDIGSESCQVFLIAEGVLPERYTMVRRDANGAPDFVYMDRYLDLWQRICGQPKYLTLYMWDQMGPQGTFGGSYTSQNSVKVTRMKSDGTLENIRAPFYGTPKSKEFWQPIFDGIRERLIKRGWRDTKVVLGVPWDADPQEEVVTFFKEMAPDWRWRVYRHGYGLPLPSAEGKLTLLCGAEVGWLEGILPAKHNYFGTVAAGYFMKRLYPYTCGNRRNYVPEGGGPFSPQWRDQPIGDLIDGSQGTSEIGLDYWFSLNVWTGRGGTPRNGLVERITTPGPNGAEPQPCYELLREGLQTAAVYRETKDRCADLTKEKKEKALEAVQAFESIISGRYAWRDPIATSQRRWNAAVRELYQVAGEVQAATPKGATQP